MTGQRASIREPDIRPRELWLRRVDGAARSRVRRPTRTLGSVELLVVLVAFAVLTGVALAGLARAQVRPVDSGIAIALATADIQGSAGGEATVSVDVLNRNLQPFAGRVVVTTEAGQGMADVQAAAGATAQIRLKVKAACGEPITVALVGPDAPDEPLDLTVDCSGVDG